MDLYNYNYGKLNFKLNIGLISSTPACAKRFENFLSMDSIPDACMGTLLIS